MIHHGAQILSFMETPIDWFWPPVMLVEKNSEMVSSLTRNRAVLDCEYPLKLREGGVAAHELYLRISFSPNHAFHT